MVKSPPSLYELCIAVAVADCVSVCKFCKKEFRYLPNNALFEFYYKMFCEKRLCLLAFEMVDLDIFNRMLTLTSKRTKLLKCFQSLMDHHGTNIPETFIKTYAKYTSLEEYDPKVVETGLRLGGFLNEGGWFDPSIKILNLTEELLLKFAQSDSVRRKLLECYHKKLHAEVIYCELKAAKDTFENTQKIIGSFEDSNRIPNLAGIYSTFSAYFFSLGQFDEALSWSNESLGLLNEDLPPRITISVLRQASKSCVVKRYFDRAKLLIRQAINMGNDLFTTDQHPHFSDTLVEYGYYLLNYDLIHESVKAYERALAIRKSLFDKNNVLVALAHEDYAYALYVYEYSSGRFYTARDNAERAIKIMERILPADHLLLSSAKRVKALILEEIALDMREPQRTESQQEYFLQAEKLHHQALESSHRAFGEHNVQTAKHYGNLGRLYQSMKRFKDAEEMHLRAISIKEKILGENDYEVGLSVGHLASLYNYHMNRYDDAETLYKRSIKINLNLFGETYSGLEYDYRGIVHAYDHLMDVENVLAYSQKMSRWKHLRAVISPPADSEEVMSISKLVSAYNTMCKDKTKKRTNEE